MASPTNTYIRRKPNYKREPAVTYTGTADAIDIAAGTIHILTPTSGVNAVTLADPADSDEDRVVWIKNGNTQANTITITNGLGGSGASYDTLTFTNVVAANVTLRAYNQKWYLVGSHLTTAT